MNEAIATLELLNAVQFVVTVGLPIVCGGMLAFIIGNDGDGLA